MKSIRTILLTASVAMLLIFCIVFIVAQNTLKRQLTNQFTVYQIGSLSSVEESILIFLEQKSEIFTQMVISQEYSNPIANSAFTDIYLLNPQGELITIYKAGPSSHIFVGYKMVYGALADFLNQPAKEHVDISPILRSVESDSISIYLKSVTDEGIMVARIDIDIITRHMRHVADNIGSILLIASSDGYIITTSNTDLPFKIVPDTKNREALLGEDYALMQMDSAVLGNRLVLLSPNEAIVAPTRSVTYTFLFLTGAILMLLTIQLLILSERLLKPIQAFIIQLSEFKPSDDIQIPLSNTIVSITHTSEIKMLYDAFANKSSEIAASFESLNTQRLQAIAQTIEQEKFAALGSLVAGVAHELNTPLGIGVTTISFLQQETDKLIAELGEGKVSREGLSHYLTDLLEAFQVMNSTLTRASELVVSFKQLAVDQTSEIEQSFDLANQLHIVHMSLRHALKHNGHQLHIQCQPNLLIVGIPGIYQQIFTNLIMNSINHAFPTNVPGNIWVCATYEEKMLKLRIQDDGIGIPIENEKRIFEPFFTTNRHAGGSGLGLNIVYNLVTRRLGGSIVVIKTATAGACFEISVPITIGTGKSSDIGKDNSSNT